jgi:hypothetical protein
MQAAEGMHSNLAPPGQAGDEQIPEQRISKSAETVDGSQDGDAAADGIRQKNLNVRPRGYVSRTVRNA